jgi:hypothetical protein
MGDLCMQANASRLHSAGRTVDDVSASAEVTMTNACCCRSHLQEDVNNKHTWIRDKKQHQPLSSTSRKREHALHLPWRRRPTRPLRQHLSARRRCCAAAYGSCTEEAAHEYAQLHRTAHGENVRAGYQGDARQSPPLRRYCPVPAHVKQARVS